MTTQEKNEKSLPEHAKMSTAEPEKQPRKIGCLTYLWGGGLVFLLLFWFNILRSVPLRISPETTHITEPLTPDGKMVDYIAAAEQKAYPPEMKTDDNGFRIVFRAIGPIEKSADIDHTQQRYEKLGLDMINDQPTLKFLDAIEYFSSIDKISPEKIDEFIPRDMEPANPYLPYSRQVLIWEKIANLPDMHELPLVRQWLEENNAALDLVVEAMKKPVFVAPMVVPKESHYMCLIHLPDIQGVRSFARGLGNRATIRISEGDIDGAIEDILACHRLGRHLSKHSFFVGQLTGLGCESIANASAYNGNFASQANAEQLQRLLDGLNNLPPRGTWEESTETERLGTLDLLQAMMRDPAEAQKILDSTGYMPSIPPAMNRIARTGIDWNVVFRKVNEAFDADIAAGSYSYVHPSPHPLRYLTLGMRSEEYGNGFLSLFMPATGAAKEAIRRLECADNLKRIQLAMFLYHAEHGTLPPAFTVDNNGKPLHSWRTLLLPYLGDESLAELYKQMKLDEPWDSEHNRQFHTQNLDIYRCPSATANKDGDSNYSVIVGDELLFGSDGKGRSLDGFGRYMFLVVERQEGICWMQPDSDMTQTVAETGIVNGGLASAGSKHTGGCNVALRDGSMMFIFEVVGLKPDHFIELVRGTAKELP